MTAYKKFDFSPMEDPHNHFTPFKRKKVIDQTDVDNARNSGFKEGEVSQLAISQRQTAEALGSIAKVMQILLGHLEQESRELREDAVEVAMSAAKAISGAALDIAGQDKILAYVKEAVANLRNVPRIIIRVPTNMLEAISPLILRTANDTGFDGQVDVIADDAAAIGDCSIEWQDGAIRLNREETLRQIEQSAQEWLQSADNNDVQLNLFGNN